MSKSTTTIITLAILAASGIAAAATPLPVGNYMGIENRDGLVPIPVCAKANLEAGTRYIWSDDPAVRDALQAGAKKGCFERLGREGDMGYSQAGVTLVREGGSVYRVAIDGKPAGQALRALTAPAEIVRHPELSERTGVVGYAGYSYTDDMTIHTVDYDDGTRDAVRRNGPTERIQPGTRVTVARQQLDAGNYWLSIVKVTQ